MEAWRIILDGRRPASFNMAADAYLLDKADTGETPPVIRLYGWNRPSITIGYHQRLERAVDIGRLGDTPIVRRPTGGRALLHDDGEITYAVAGNFVRYPILGDCLHESYRMIAEAIVKFYAGLGIEASVSRRDDPPARPKRSEVQKGCFASVSRYEIIVAGMKIAAGSQRRTGQAFMQHGVVRLRPSPGHPAIQEPTPNLPDGAFAELVNERRELEETLVGSLAQVYDIKAEIRPFSGSETAGVESQRRRFKNLNTGDLSLNARMV